MEYNNFEKMMTNRIKKESVSPKVQHVQLLYTKVKDDDFKIGCRPMMIWVCNQMMI